MDPILVETEGWKTDTMTTLGLEASEGPLRSRPNYGNILLTRHLDNMFDTLRGVAESFESSNLVASVLAPRILKNNGKAKRLPSRSGYSAKILLGTAPSAVNFQFADLNSASSETLGLEDAQSHNATAKDKFRVTTGTTENTVPQLRLKQHGIQRSQQNLLNFDEGNLDSPKEGPVIRSVIRRQLVQRHKRAKRGMMPQSQVETSQEHSIQTHVSKERVSENEQSKQQIGNMMEEDLGLNIVGHKNMLRDLAPVGNPDVPKKPSEPISVFKRLKRLINEDSTRRPILRKPQLPLDLSLDFSTDQKNKRNLDHDFKSWSLENTSARRNIAGDHPSARPAGASLQLQVKTASKMMQKTNLVRIRDMSSSDNYTFTSAKAASHSVDSRRGLPAADLPRIPLEALPTRESSHSVRPIHLQPQPPSAAILGTPATTQQPAPSLFNRSSHDRSQQQQQQQRTVLRATAQEYRGKYRQQQRQQQQYKDTVLEPGVEGFGVVSRPSAGEDRRRVVEAAMGEVRGLLSRTACNARLGFLFAE